MAFPCARAAGASPVTEVASALEPGLGEWGSGRQEWAAALEELLEFEVRRSEVEQAFAPALARAALAVAADASGAEQRSESQRLRVSG